jgi:poly-gamma-glutamate synthesis protein (capsule biosynthesis protein)
MRLFLCGDVMLARGIDQILAEPCDPKLYEPYMDDARDYIQIAEHGSGPIPRSVAPEYPWGDALALLDAAGPDVRIINLETSITRRGAHDPSKQIHYRVSPENAATLSAARVDVCTLANNHVLDWGEPGLLDTLDTLDALGIAHCGAGRNLDDAKRPAVIERGAQRIAVFAVGCADAGVPSWWAGTADRAGVFVLEELDDVAVRAVRDAVERWRGADTVIVLSIHWGGNWGFGIPRAHRNFARDVIDHAGVDIVHGHSSHHVKGIEVHRGHPILYGCGDLLTDYEGIRGNELYRGELSLLYLLTLDATGALGRLDMIPTRMRRFQITEAELEDARWLAATLTRSGDALGTSVVLTGSRLQLAWSRHP